MWARGLGVDESFDEEPGVFEEQAVRIRLKHLCREAEGTLAGIEPPPLLVANVDRLAALPVCPTQVGASSSLRCSSTPLPYSNGKVTSVDLHCLSLSKVGITTSNEERKARTERASLSGRPPTGTGVLHCRLPKRSHPVPVGNGESPRA